MSDWRTIDSAPKDGTNILLYVSKTVRIGYMGGTWSDGGKEWVGHWELLPGNDRTYAEPTHWMPVPAPPRSDQ